MIDLQGFEHSYIPATPHCGGYTESLACSQFLVGCVVIALLLRSHYDNEDPATLSLWRCSYALATTSAMELRFRCVFVSFLYKIGGLTAFMFI